MSVSFVRGHPLSKPRVERVWPAAGAAESTTIMHLPRTEYQETMNRARASGDRRPATAARAIHDRVVIVAVKNAARRHHNRYRRGRLPSRDDHRPSRDGKRRLCTRGAVSGSARFASTTAVAT